MDALELLHHLLVAGAYDLRSVSKKVQSRRINRIYIHPECESTKKGIKGNVGIFVPLKPFIHVLDYVEGILLPTFKNIAVSCLSY